MTVGASCGVLFASSVCVGSAAFFACLVYLRAVDGCVAEFKTFEALYNVWLRWRA